MRGSLLSFLVPLQSSQISQCLRFIMKESFIIATYLWYKNTCTYRGYSKVWRWIWNSFHELDRILDIFTESIYQWKYNVSSILVWLTFRHAASRTGEGNFNFSKLVPYFFALRSLPKKKEFSIIVQIKIKLNLKCCSYFTPATFHFSFCSTCMHPPHPLSKTP